MCGITGFWTQPTINRLDLEHQVKRMADELIHRGPDDFGSWVDEKTGVALGFRRLAILDLSPEGHQPMVSFCGRYVIIFNGEIYNYQILRQELSTMGCKFKGSSDTEVLLTAVSIWGIEKTLNKLVGMYAFVLWDKEKHELTLVRDRLGIKPLYYGWINSTFIFGSELKPFRLHPAFQGTIDRGSLTLLMQFNAIPAPHSIYQNIHQLLPGSTLTINSQEDINAKPISYWLLDQVANKVKTQPFSGTEREAIDQLEQLLKDAIQKHMVSDVPLGAFLSGGIDSSTVVALMQSQSSIPIKTFTIGFYEDKYNEARFAKNIAKYLGTDHTEFYLTPKEVQVVIPKLPEIYDEPFSDWSQIPTYLLSQMTRKQVTVSLSGDGGDELFAGYSHYFRINNAFRWIHHLPKPVRLQLGRIIDRTSKTSTTYWLDRWIPLHSDSSNMKFFHHRLEDLGSICQLDLPEDYYHWAISYWRNATELVQGGKELPNVFDWMNGYALPKDFIHKMMLIDTASYLPNDILTKVDRASMAVSLEARVPLLDHRVVEFTWQLPLALKVRNGKGKWILRQVLYRHVPSHMVERPKQGFSLPLGVWLRGPLRAWADDMLNENRIKREGYFNSQLISSKWDEHKEGKRDWLRCLWNVIMFQAWKEYWKV